MIAGAADPERRDRGAAIAVERGAQGKASLDQRTGVTNGGRLIRWAKVGECRVLGGERHQRSPHGGVDDSEDGELRGAAEVADERAWPWRKLVEQVTVGAGTRHARPRSTRASWTS